MPVSDPIALTILLALAMVVLLSLFLAPLLQVLARRLFMRWKVPVRGFVPLLAFYPALAFAQAVAPAPSSSGFGALVAQYLPLILMGLLAILATMALPYIRTVLQGWASSATSSAAKRELAAVLLPVEHLAEVFVADLRASTGTTGGAINLDSALAALKQAIGTDGAKDLESVLGVGSAALEQYLKGLLQTKLAGPQLTAATQAAVAANSQAAMLPVPAIAAKLAAGPS